MKLFLVVTLFMFCSTTGVLAQADNRIPGMASTAQKIKMGELTPAWQTQLKDPEVDELLVVPGGGVLVGLTSIYWDEYLWGSYCPEYGSYVMYDETTGQEKWSFAREKSYNNTYQVISYSPLILIRFDKEKDTKYIALDPQTGKTKWSFSALINSRVCFDQTTNSIIIEEMNKSNLTLSSVDLSDGNVLWKVVKENFSVENILPQLNSNGKLLFLLGKNLSAFSIVDGKQNWMVQVTGLSEELSFLAMLPNNDIIVTTTNNQISYIDQTGIVKWENKLDFRPGIILADQGCIFLQSIISEANERISCYNLQDGKLSWDHGLNGKLLSHIIAAEGKLVYTLRTITEEHLLEIIDEKNGNLVKDQVLPFKSELSLSDRLVSNQGEAIVVSESGVGAFRLKDGAKLWLYKVKDPEGVYANHVNNWGKAFQAYMSDNVADNKKSQIETENEFKNYSANSLTVWAKNNLAEVLSRTNPIISAESNASHLDKQLAIGDQKLASQFLMTSMEFEKSMDAMRSNLNISMTGIMLGQKELEKRKQALSVSRAQHWFWGLRAINKIQINNIQGDFYVHSFAADDNSVAVIIVNLKNGRWQEIRNSPYCSDYFDETMDFRFPVLSGDGKKLFLRGIGLDSTKWVAAKAKDKILLKGGSSVGVYNNAYILPAPSLLSYNITDDDFVDSTKYSYSHFYGYANKAGKIIIKPKFEWAGPFSGGVATIQLNGKYGFIDDSGKILANPQFDEINEFHGEIACVKKGDKYGYINKQGKIVIPVQLDDGGYFQNGTSVIKINGKSGVIDQTGKYILEPVFENLTRSIPDGEQIMYKINNKWGYVLAGGIRIEAKFDDWQLFAKNGLASVKLDGKWGFIDKNGDFVIKPIYEKTKGFYKDGFAAVKIDNKWGLIDSKGVWIMKPQYDDFDSYLDGMGCVEINKKWGYINKNGDVIIKPQFDEADPYFLGRARVLKGKKYGFINKKGELAIPFQFEKVNGFYGGDYSEFRKNDKWGLIDTVGNVVLAPKFDDVSTTVSEGLVAIKISGKWGFANLAGKIIIQPQYDFVLSFVHGKAKVEKDKNNIYIDNKGNVTSPPQVVDKNNKGKSVVSGDGDLFPVYPGKKYWLKGEINK